MNQDTRIAVVELSVLRETIREILREELEKHGSPNSTDKVSYNNDDRLSISQVAEYLGVSNKTVSNYRRDRKIPEPEYNLSGKPRWTVAQLQEANNARKAKQKFPVS